MIKPGESFTAESQTMYVYLESKREYPGFSADVTFVDIPSCT